MKKLIVITSLLAFLLIPAHSVFAHVLVMDETKTKGAILHIVPDDDPVAGERATLYFDVQEQFSEQGNSAALSIRDANGSEKIIKTEVDGSLATANYTFPSQGAYNLTFTATLSDGKTYTFKQAQRVSRGTTTGTLDKPEHAWAEVLLLAGSIGIILLGIVAFNRRKDIADQSTF